MLRKLFTALLLPAFGFGYLEWGRNQQHGFVYEAALEVFRTGFRHPLEVLHPLILVPLAGVVLLLIELFRHRYSRLRTWLGAGCLAVLMLVILLVGVLDQNLKIAGSTLPFFTLVTLLFFQVKKERRNVS